MYLEFVKSSTFAESKSNSSFCLSGLQMLHNIMKQYRQDFKKIPILRKLLKVLRWEITHILVVCYLHFFQRVYVYFNSLFHAIEPITYCLL